MTRLNPPWLIVLALAANACGDSCPQGQYLGDDDRCHTPGETAPSSDDNDGDGSPAGEDCDDSNAALNHEDADNDGVDACASDCDDQDSARFPGNDEVCNGGIDDDCDPASEEDVEDGSLWYADADGDGFGDPEAVTPACVQPAGQVADNQDCDDAARAVNPDAKEICNIGVDDNCDGEVDDEDLGITGQPTWYGDEDGDGHGDPSAQVVSCAQPTGSVVDDDDCDDANPATFSGALELCDGLDNDCDLLVPPEETDNDGDGESECAGDCDDLTATTFSGAAEICNGLDDDCANGADDGLPFMNWFVDGDGDGYGDPAAGVSSCDDLSGSLVLDDTDCDDNSAALNHDDLDADGQDTCGGDCDDLMATTFLGAPESCNGVDDDCMGGVDDDFACTLDTDELPAGSDQEIIDAIVAAEAAGWPDTGGAVEFHLPFADAVHMGVSQGTTCASHAGALEGSVDFNVDGSSYESSNDMKAVAAAAGTVVRAVTDVIGYVGIDPMTGFGSYGNNVLLHHSDGSYTVYAHLLHGSIPVQTDDVVCAGQTLGTIGSTGTSTGDHLHFEQLDLAGARITTPSFVEIGPAPSTCYPCTTASHLTGCYASTNVETQCGNQPCVNVGLDAYGVVAGVTAAFTATQARWDPQIGCPFAAGPDGEFVHNVRGVTLQDFYQADQNLWLPGSADGLSAIIYDPVAADANLIYAGFWGTYKCIQEGGQPNGGAVVLGAPSDEEHACSDGDLVDIDGDGNFEPCDPASGVTIQNFALGYMWWDGVTIHVHLNDHTDLAYDELSQCVNAPVVENPPGPGAPKMLTVGCGGDYTILQDAVNDATDGDTISICSGTYSGPTVIDGKALTIDGTGEAFVSLTATTDQAIMKVLNGATVTLTDLSILDGHCPALSFCALYVAGGSTATLGNVAILDTVGFMSPGLKAVDSNVTLDGVSIGRITASSGDGAGIVAWWSTVNATGSSISGNVASAGMGGGVAAEGATLDFTDTLVSSNTSASAGGGFYLTSGSQLAMTGGEVAYNTSGNGGGLEVSGYSTSVSLEYVSLIFNVATIERAGAMHVAYAGLGDMTEVTITSCDFGAGASENLGWLGGVPVSMDIEIQDTAYIETFLDVAGLQSLVCSVNTGACL